MNLNFNIAIVQNVSINDHRMVHTDGVARELVRRGYNVEVIIQESKEESPFKDPSYKVTYLPGETYSMLGQLKFGYYLFKLLKKKKYDIIHAKNPFSSVIPALLMRPKVKVVYDMRGLWVDFGVHSRTIPKIIAPFLNKFDILCMKKADRVIAISQELRKILVKRGVKEEKIKVIIGDGVDLSKAINISKKEIRDFLGINGKVVGYVGGIGRSRYSDRVIEAFDIVRNKSKTKVKLVLIGPILGSPDEEEYFQRIVTKKGLDGDIFFTKFITSHDEVLQFIKSFDVAISYHQENTPCFNVMVPTKVLEYLATGRSIVATDHQSHKNLFTHGKDAYLTRQNPRSFAEGILKVLEDEELSKRISKNALITAQKYSFRTVTNMIEDVYLNTI